MTLRILSVDDNKFIQDIQGKLVGHLGHDVVRAMSGREALDILMRERFDVVLMDVQMPEMDGFDTLKAIRAKGIRTPIIAVTGSDTPEEVASFKAAGFNGFVAKPIKTERLASELNRVLGRF